MNFRIDGSIAGSGVLSGGAAAFTTNSLAHGSHTVTAEYAGDVNFIGTTNSLAQAEVINTPPVAGDVKIARFPTEGVKVRLATLLAADSDADGDTLTQPSVRPAKMAPQSPSAAAGCSIRRLRASRARIRSPTRSQTATVAAPLERSRSPSKWMTPRQNLTITSLGNGSFLIQGSGVPERTYRLQLHGFADSRPTGWTFLEEV